MTTCETQSVDDFLEEKFGNMIQRIEGYGISSIILTLAKLQDAAAIRNLVKEKLMPYKDTPDMGVSELMDQIGQKDTPVPEELRKLLIRYAKCFVSVCQ